MTAPLRPFLAASHMSAPAQQQVSTFHRDFVDEVRAAIDTHPLVVLGMAQNPVVRKARRALDRAGIPHHDIDHGSYLSGYRRRLAIKMWTGFPTFPQVFVQGVLLGGCTELLAALQDGSVARLLKEPRDAGPC